MLVFTLKSLLSWFLTRGSLAAFMVPWKNSHQLWNLASALAKQPSVSHQGQKDKQIEPRHPYLGARGRTMQTHSGWGASSKSTVAHARQRMLTVCSLTWREPVKYALSTKQLLQAASLTASMRAQTYKKKGRGGGQKILTTLLWSLGCNQNKQRKAAASTREICWPGGRDNLNSSR